MPHLTPLERKSFEKFLVFVGCQLKRQKGDHLIYTREDLKRPIVFTTDKEVPVFIIRNNLRTLKMGLEEYLEILKRI